jgi:regulator of sigma E protease
VDPNPTADGKSVTPATATQGPDTPQSLSGWFRQNGVQLAIVVAVIVVVCSYLHPLDVLLAVLGLSLIIFIHELGHFAAAKWCGVHVKTFSIGFGPALPFGQFKYGETTYKLAMIPLGGYVAMVGEGETEGDTVEAEDDPDRADADPRSFKNKPVGQRMLIISAGVIMNVLLGGVCFAIAYLHGVEEPPAIASAVEPGSGAWRAGLRPGTEIKRINGRVDPWFDDLRPAVMSVQPGEQVSLTVQYRGQREDLAVQPFRQEGALFPQLGIAPPQRLTLRSFRRDDIPPYGPETPAASAVPGFQPGDRIVAMTDPADPSRVTDIDPGWNNLPGGYFDYQRRLEALAGQPITFHVVRKDDPSGTRVPVTVERSMYRFDLGLMMRMDRVAAVRQGSPAERAGVQARRTDGDKVVVPGDRIKAVQLPEPDGTTTRYTADKDDAPTDPRERVRPLDPIRLPWELNQWAARWQGEVFSKDRPSDGRPKVRLTVLRHGEHTEEPVTLELDWDPEYASEGMILANPGTPTAIGGLGLAYHVQAVVDAVEPFAAADRERFPASAAAFGAAGPASTAAPSPAAAAGLQTDDQIVEVRFKAVDHAGKVRDTGWGEVRPHQWAYADYRLQLQAPHVMDARVKRGNQVFEVTLAATEDPTWPVADRGLELSPERQLQKAEGLIEALRMGADRTARSVKMIYLGLYSMIFGQISYKMMSGPIGLARVSYILAGEDFWHLLVWMGLISINLAVINFLPIPVLDGGHMMFLLYELVRGKPAPLGVQVILTYLGLAIILALMLFVIGLDIWRLL